MFERRMAVHWCSMHHVRMTLLKGTTGNGALDRAREKIVRTHVEAEQRGDWTAALRTFHHPRYEVTPTNEVADGEEAVMRFYNESARAFPDMSFETRAFYHAGTTIVHEVTLRGTHCGTWRGLPPSERVVQYAMLNLFLFEEDRLVCERMYFDLLTPMRQLGIARDPTSLTGQLGIACNHPLTIGGALVRQAMRAFKS